MESKVMSLMCRDDQCLSKELDLKPLAFSDHTSIEGRPQPPAKQSTNFQPGLERHHSTQHHPLGSELGLCISQSRNKIPVAEEPKIVLN
jgi:hypothetical protein